MVDRCYDLYIPDVGSDDSEYGSYFYASIDMPSVEGLIPPASTRTLRTCCFLHEESMSEPRIMVYHEWLLANQCHHVHCISDRVGVSSKNQRYTPTPFMSFQRFIVGENPSLPVSFLSLHTDRVFTMAPSLIEGTRNDPSAAYILKRTRWGYFHRPHGGWGPMQNSMPLNAAEGLRIRMIGVLPFMALQFFVSDVWRW